MDSINRQLRRGPASPAPLPAAQQPPSSSADWSAKSWLRERPEPNRTANSVITDSYCTASAGQATVCIGVLRLSGHPAIPTSTAAQLQTPTGYTGIYENWNVDIDGDTFPDNPLEGFCCICWVAVGDDG